MHYQKMFPCSSDGCRKRMENNIVGFRPGQVIFPKIAPVSFLKKHIPKRFCMQTATQKGA